ncbi:MAG: hypothetical protein JXB47_15435 [Anaerolineae bacterium]|nr:hypothetical protein [Anaerolineae bacterium]
MDDRDSLLDGLLAPSEEDDQDDEGYRLLGLIDDGSAEEDAEPPSENGGSLRKAVAIPLFLVAVGLVVVAVVVVVRGRTVVPPDTLAAEYPQVLNDLRDALALDGRPGAAADFRTSPEGTALFGRFCWDGTGGAASWRGMLAPALETVTVEAAPLQEAGLRAVGVELARCGTDDILFWGVVRLDRAIAHYLRGESTEATFRATWITGP